MDAAGKDSAIKHVMSGVNPQGCQVFSFKHPSATELDHDFLWRTTRALPERGRIGIFNRSYYEEVLIVRVHPAILRTERLPDPRLDEKTIWQQHRHDQRHGPRSWAEGGASCRRCGHVAKLQFKGNAAVRPRGGTRRTSRRRSRDSPTRRHMNEKDRFRGREQNLTAARRGLAIQPGCAGARHRPA